MGELRSKVRRTIHQYLLNDLTDEEFKAHIQEIIDEFEGKIPGVLYQDIGMVVLERENKKLRPERFKKIWVLLDQVNPKIREDLDIYRRDLK